MFHQDFRGQVDALNSLLLLKLFLHHYLAERGCSHQGWMDGSFPPKGSTVGQTAQVGVREIIFTPPVSGHKDLTWLCE